MRIRLRLMGMLKASMPADGALKIDDDATIRAALLALDIPADSVQVFQVNGQLERDKDRKLSAGDELTVLPPVGGG